MNDRFDIAVIGGGPAGTAAALTASRAGASVVLIERAHLGGTCLNWGCIPTKFYWEALDIAGMFKRAGDWGISASDISIDFSAVRLRKDRAVGFLRSGLRKLLTAQGVVVIEGTARRSGPGRIVIEHSGEPVRQISAGSIIVACGSRPSSAGPYIPGRDGTIAAQDLLDAPSLPESICIIGGGAIGVELASIAAGFGSRVTIAERLERILPAEDPDISREITRLLERRGISVHAGTEVSAEMISAHAVTAVAAGRTSRSDEAGISISPVNEYLETGEKGVYAAGDCAGRTLLAYTAQHEGVIAAENAMGARRSAALSHIARVVFGPVTCASVGRGEHECDPAAIRIGRFPLTANARAMIGGARTGWVKIIADRKTGRITGAHMVSSAAEEIIPVLVMAVRRGLTDTDLERAMFFHPSIGEAVAAACEDARGACIDLPRRPS